MLTGPFSDNTVTWRGGELKKPCEQNCTPYTDDLIITPGSNLFTYVLAGHFEMKLFPNSANDMVNIHLHGLEAEGTLNIYDNLGCIVWSQQVDQNQHVLQLDLNKENFENGIYLLFVFSSGEKITKSLVITK